MGRKVDEQSRTEVTWEDPPSNSGATFNWVVIAEKLQASPMTWAKIGDDVRVSVINAVRQGNVQAVHPDLGFEVRTANNVRQPVRMATFYLRFNPEAVQDELRDTILQSRKDTD